MILDKEGKLFGRVNVLDFLMIISTLMLVGIIIFKFTATPAKPKAKPLKVTVFVDEVQPEVAEKMKDNKDVYFGRGLVKTTVENVEILPMPAGSRRPDFKEVRITLSGDGYIYDDGAYLENQRVSLNKKIWLRSVYEVEATVMDIR